MRVDVSLAAMFAHEFTLDRTNSMANFSPFLSNRLWHSEKRKSRSIEDCRRSERNAVKSTDSSCGRRARRVPRLLWSESSTLCRHVVISAVLSVFG
jgi:hypothetical protein